MQKKVCSFGEILLRYAIPTTQHWINLPKLAVYLGGAELNVATALAHWGVPVKYCTVMPDNFMTEQIENDLAQLKIDVSAIQKMGERVGSYYLAEGADVKHAGIIYDRAHSAFSALTVGMIDWETVLNDCEWLHFSAIVPALNLNLVAVCHEALRVATTKGIQISIDLNYRAKLWTYTKDIISIMQPIVNQCDMVMGNVWAAHILLGIPLNDAQKDVLNSQNCLEQAAETSAHIFAKFPKVKIIANTFRFANDSETTYYGTLHLPTSNNQSPVFKTNTVVDKVGSGDCFMAGLIYGCLQNNDNQTIINYAAAAAFGKLQEKGDATQQTVAQIKQRISINA
jgi:2-dehydro-3-deoxygluconokinase